MASKLLWHLMFWVITGIVALILGKWPGMIAMHPSGEASYVNRSHCLVSTEVTHERFLVLQEWCAGIHKAK